MTEAADAIGVKAVTVARWIKRMRHWILELDPTGHWEAKVRLGMEIRPEIPCPRCGAADRMHYRGFDAETGERRCRCDACGYYRRLSDLIREQGSDFVLEQRVSVRPPSSRRKS